MKRFTFDLEKVLEIRKLEEQKKMRELGTEVRELSKQRAHKEEAENLRLAFQDRFSALDRVGHLDPLHFRRYQTYQSVLTSEVRRCDRRIARQEPVVDEKREEMKQAHCKTKIMEKIRELEFDNYRREAEKDMQKELTELALQNHRRRRQQGSAANVALAIGALFAFSLVLFAGLLFMAGYLSPEKVEVIGHVMAYDQKLWDKLDVEKENALVAAGNKQSNDRGLMIVSGEKVPYIIRSTEYLRLLETEKAYNKVLAEDVDDENVLTIEVLETRKNILRRVKETLFNERDRRANLLSTVAEKEKALEKEKESFATERQMYDEKLNQAQASLEQKGMKTNLRAIRAMDEGNIAKIITNEKKLEDFKTPVERDAAVRYAAKYLSQLEDRKRAAVLEVLDPAWALAIFRQVEKPTP